MNALNETRRSKGARLVACYSYKQELTFSFGGGETEVQCHTALKDRRSTEYGVRS